MTISLTLATFEQLCFDLACQAEWNAQEPIPEFNTRYPGRLESCLETPLQTYGGEPLYPTLLDQAAILFYLLNKNHPFLNGNKRIALTAALVFLFLNGKWISVDPEALYELSIGVAGSPAREKGLVVDRIRNFFARHLTNVGQIAP